MVTRILIAIAVSAAASAAGCQGKREGAGGGGSSAPAVEPADAGGGSGSGSGGGKFGTPPEQEPRAPERPERDRGAERPDRPRGSGSAEEPEAAPDASKQIAELGAIPAWQAVIDRAQLLARRNQRGVVYGRVGPAVAAPVREAPAAPGSPAAPAAPADAGAAAADAGAPAAGGAGASVDAGAPAPDAGAPAVAAPYVWLIDDTEGNGALGIRLALGAARAREGERIAAAGAWELDESRRWYWKVDAIQPLAPRAPLTSDVKDPPAAAPSHELAAGPPPAGARPIKAAKDHDAVTFQLVGPPPTGEGDGWPIASALGEPQAALLILPGERTSYGGLDMRTPDERWQLKRQTSYWVRIGKLRPQGAGKPFLVYARTAPVRVAAAPPAPATPTPAPAAPAPAPR